MLLDISEFNLWFKGYNDKSEPTEEQVLFDISFSLQAGQSVALVGESGSGKTITALSILRLLEETHNIRQQGTIVFDGKEITKLSKEELRSIRGNRIGMIFQEPMSSLNPVYTIGNQLLEPLKLHRNLSGKQAEEEAASLLERTGIVDGRSRLRCYPHELSGGQRQRVMIAMALACRPALLIADEPTTALDVTIQAQILQLLKSVQKEYNMGLLLITHDLDVVKQQADFIHILEKGRIVEQGPTNEVFSAPAHDYTKKLLSAIPDSRKKVGVSGPTLLQTKELSCTFSSYGKWIHPFKREKKITQAVNNVSLTLQAGSTCGIVGESGSGKTTLGLAILKLTQSRGNILFDGQDIQAWPPARFRPLRSEMQIVFQDPYGSLSPRFTVKEIIEEGLTVHRPELTAVERYSEVIRILEEVQLSEDMAFRYPHEFSGGQRQRIAIARALILKPKFLILDEPTSALDVTIQGQIIDLLLELQKKHNLTYLFISHDLRVVRALADYIVVMKNGEIVEAGPAEEIITTPKEEYTKSLFHAVFGRAALTA